MTTWLEAQQAEVEWWESWVEGQLWADIEQMEMARWMGLEVDDRLTIHTEGVIWDIGGGPVSLLLKSVGFTAGVVIDPAPYPAWTRERYYQYGIEVERMKAETAFVVLPDPDEVWIYNTLQHVEDPQWIVEQAVKTGAVVRLFEWVEEPLNECHIHTLHADDLERWALDAGASVTSRTHELNGVKCYAGVFR